MKNRSRVEYSLFNIFIGLGGYFLNTLLGFICRMVFVRTLTADYLGVNGLFSNIISMLSLAELGIGSAVTYALYKPLAEHDEEKIASLVKIYGTAYKIVGLIVGIIGIILLPFLNIIITDQPNINESIYILYLLNLFNTASTYFFSYRSSLLIAAQRNYIVSGVNYIITILQSIVQMVILYTTHNYLGYLLVQTIGTFIYNILVSRIAVIQFPYIKKKNIKPLSKEEKKKLFANVRDLLIYKLSGLLVNSTDNILITYFKGLTTTGIASNYTLLVNTLNSLLEQLFNGLTASVGNHNALENNQNKYKMFSFLNFLGFWIYGWATLGIYFFSSDLVLLFFGEKYVLSKNIPFILAFNFYLVGSTNVIGMYKHTLGLFYYGRFIQIITGILNIILSILFGNYFGLFGILAATGIARLLTHFWYTPYTVFKHGFKVNFVVYIKKYLKYLFVLIFCGISYRLSLYVIFEFYNVNVLFKMFICSIFINCFFFIYFYNTEEFERLKIYLKRIVIKYKNSINVYVFKFFKGGKMNK